MPFMRAKMRVAHIISDSANPNYEQIRFTGVPKSTAYPADGSDEDNTFAKFSPSVELNMTIANPALLGKLKPGDMFYVDFTAVPTKEASK